MAGLVCLLKGITHGPCNQWHNVICPCTRVMPAAQMRQDATTPLGLQCLSFKLTKGWPVPDENAARIVLKVIASFTPQPLSGSHNTVEAWPMGP